MTRALGPACLLALAILGQGCGPKVEPEPKPAPAAALPTVEVVKVVRQRLSSTTRLPGELRPFEAVAVYPKVTGFLKWIGVDRGSVVSKGQLIARLEAPELVAQRAEAQSKLESAEAQRLGAEAKLASDTSTYEKLRAASETPGVVAGNDLVVAEKTMDADGAHVKALEHNVLAAKQALRSLEEIAGYLEVRAPFDGVVTERNVHPGALIGPAGGPGAILPIVRIETQWRLRLVVPVPETYLAGIPRGARVRFTVPAFPGATFSAPVARVAQSVDVKTRTMPVELDVMNPAGRLAAGTFTEVLWPVTRPEPTLFVPASAVVRTTERTFVVGVREAKTAWIDVQTGVSTGSLVEVFGDLREGEDVAVRGTDELKPGTRVTTRSAPTPGPPRPR